ncbi:MAG: hypothetical protein E7Z92_03975 [Cyanobacteria bacterium SIG31]|nr:hypothetical protein [Cyanobacteria bacterium SIG31]
MDIVQIRRAKPNRKNIATTRLWSCFGLTRGRVERSLGVPFGRYAMNELQVASEKAVQTLSLSHEGRGYRGGAL